MKVPKGNVVPVLPPRCSPNILSLTLRSFLLTEPETRGQQQVLNGLQVAWPSRGLGACQALA